MTSNPSFLKDKRIEYLLTLDIGTEAVKALIFQKPTPENEKVIIWGSFSDYFEEPIIFDLRDFEENIIKTTLLKIIKEAYQNFLRIISKEKQKVVTNFKSKNLPTFIGLPAHILKSKVVPQSIERKNPQEIITEKEEEDIYQLVFKKTKEKITENFSQELFILPGDIKFLDQKILEIKIDGYEISNLQGFKGKRLDFRILATFLLKDYLQKIEKIAKDLNLNILKIVAKSQNLPQLFSDERVEAIFIDIGGEISEIFLVKKGKLEATSEFRGGGIHFTETISQTLGLGLQDSRILKHNYSNLLLTEEVRKRVREILSGEIQTWFENLKKTLKKLSFNQRILLPSEIFLFGGGSLLPEIREILEEGEWEDLPLISKPKVKLILPKDIRNIEDKTQVLTSPQDIGPILLCCS